MKRWEIYLEIFMEVLIFLAVIFFIGYGLPKLLAFFWPIVAAAVLAMITNPLKRLLEQHLRLPKRVGATLMIILLLALVSFAIYGLFIGIAALVSWLSQIIPGLYDEVIVGLDDFMERLVGWLSTINADAAGKLMEMYHKLGAEIGAEIGGFIAKIGTQHVDALGGIASSLTNFVIGIIVMFLSAYFLLVYYDNIRYFFHNIKDERLRQNLHLISSNVLGSVGQYIWAQIKLMLIIALILLVGLLILGRSQPVLLAFLISLLDAIPFFGTGTVLCPWAVVCLVEGDIFLAIGLVVLYAICLLARQLLQPKIIGETIGMNPFVTLILMYVGTKLAGLVGFMISVLLGIIVYRLYEIGIFDGMLRRMKHRMEMLRNTD